MKFYILVMYLWIMAIFVLQYSPYSQISFDRLFSLFFNNLSPISSEHDQVKFLKSKQCVSLTYQCVKSFLIRSSSGVFFSSIWTEYGPEKLRIGSLITQCILSKYLFFYPLKTRSFLMFSGVIEMEHCLEIG